MSKPMTPEGLRERIVATLRAYKPFVEEAVITDEEYPEIRETFIQFCDENNICQIYQLNKTTNFRAEIHHFKSVKEVLKE